MNVVFTISTLLLFFMIITISVLTGWMIAEKILNQPKRGWKDN